METPENNSLNEVCLNCGKILNANFCSNCGQKANTSRINFKYLLVEIPKNFFSWHSGFFFTIKELTLKPEKGILLYIKGKRVKRYPPISYLIIFSTISFLLGGILLRYDKIPETYKDLLPYLSYGGLVFAFCTSFGYYISSRWTSKLNYWEFIVAKIYVYGHTLFIFSIGLFLCLIFIKFDNPIFFIFTPIAFLYLQYSIFRFLNLFHSAGSVIMIMIISQLFSSIAFGVLAIVTVYLESLII